MGAFSSSECISMYDDIYDLFKICKGISGISYAPNFIWLIFFDTICTISHVVFGSMG